MSIKPFAFAISLVSSLALGAGEFTVTLKNGKTPRTNAIVQTLAVPNFPPGGALVHSSGKSIPFQADKERGIRFIVPSLGSDEQGVYKVQPGQNSPGENGVKAIADNQKVAFNAGRSALLAYQGKETELPRPDIKPAFKRGGYLHPIYSPSGRVITDDYPPNHIHHHGIWMPWTKTEFEGRSPDFWNMGENKGKVEFVRLKENWSGPVAGGLITEHRFIDLTSGQAKAALNETWTISSYGIVEGEIKANVFDFESVQTTATDSPLKLPKYHYGGLGFRGNWAWNGAGKTFFLSSDGTTNRVAGNETRANWCYIGGEVDGQQTGIVILCHPKNFRAPQPMRWHPTEPFFCYAPSQLGDWEIKPGEPYISRYRFVVFDGKPNRDWIENHWQNYANPPEVKVTAQ